MTFDAMFSGADPTPGATAKHGDVEKLGDVTAAHWYQQADGLTWHGVVAGDYANPPLIFLHGFPESWYAWVHQIRDLSDQYLCIAPDLIGYGQSDKRPEGEIDYDYAAIAKKLGALIDSLGLDRFSIVAHDRGAVITDHLCSVAGFNDRMDHYIRMQQSGCEPHSEPRPPHEFFHSNAGAQLFADAEAFMNIVYRSDQGLVAVPIADQDIARLTIEWSHAGVAQGASASFKSAGFDRELKDRLDFLFDKMTMPVLFLQGALDPGQQPSEYDKVTGFVGNGHLEFIEAGHFLHLETPDLVTKFIRRFLQDH